MFFLRPPPAASKRTRVCFFGGEAAEKTHILFCARSLIMRLLKPFLPVLCAGVVIFCSSCKKDEPIGTDAGSGSVTAKIDGQSWASKNEVNGAVYGASQGSHTIQAHAADGSFISLLIPVPISSGATLTSDNGSLSAQYKPDFMGAISYTTVTSLGAGTITFTTFSNSKVKGTFSFTGAYFDGTGAQQNVAVTNGSFDFDL